jgi:hypothetical protein
MLFDPAHCDAVSAETSRPSGATVYDLLRFAFSEYVRLDCEEGVGGAAPPSDDVLP